MSLLTTRFEILSLPFELTTNDRKFFKEFQELNSALTSPPNGHPPISQYSVIKNTKYFCIREDGKFRLRWGHRWPLYIFVMMCVRDRLYQYLKDYLFLHSGAVANGDKALLLAGTSGSGKSTLTLALLNYGYKYLTDEVTIINLPDLLVMPFQRPIYIERWLSTISPAVRKKFKFCRFKEKVRGVMDPWHYVLPQGKAVLPKHPRFKVAWIVFPRYNRAQESSYLRPVSKAEAIFRLMQLGWNSPVFKDGGLKVCSELVKRADCYCLEMGDLKEACELVRGLVGGVSSLSDARVLDNIWKGKYLM